MVIAFFALLLHRTFLETTHFSFDLLQKYNIFVTFISNITDTIILII